MCCPSIPHKLENSCKSLDLLKNSNEEIFHCTGIEFWSPTLPAWGTIFAFTLATLGIWELSSVKTRSFFIEFLVLNFIEALSSLGPVVIVQYLNFWDIILLSYFSYCSKKRKEKRDISQNSSGSFLLFTWLFLSLVSICYSSSLFWLQPPAEITFKTVLSALWVRIHKIRRTISNNLLTSFKSEAVGLLKINVEVV